MYKIFLTRANPFMSIRPRVISSLDGGTRKGAGMPERTAFRAAGNLVFLLTVEGRTGKTHAHHKLREWLRPPPPAQVATAL